MKNKRGWLKLVEAGLAIILLGSILLIVYTNNNLGRGNYNFLQVEEERILNEIASNESLRGLALAGSEGALEDWINLSLVDNYGFKVNMCGLSSCGVGPDLSSIDKDIFVRERIISSNLTSYSPKRVRLYMWVN